MQRLEAARQAGLLSAIPEVDADEFNSIPPTNANTNADLGNAGFAAKPAHLLVAELEEAEARKREKARATTSEDVGLGDDPSGSLSIAALEITKPKAKLSIIWLGVDWNIVHINTNATLSEFFKNFLTTLSVFLDINLDWI